ncbi:translation initiation factor IF-1 [Candidatus Liberibacter americanus]|uniref:Translation initiation factor IF-1 n=1 Tax=Candidatus Liberibacter americanus str. Sao Paulo TaxID=1261131 RepID=U6B3H9_9HYPH|nr:translation initiation factor IF-1 [Candidatus Liberibacter americanus]AHA27480.1 Translation initiation factor IF-1 [Candidatus Liberibacter americanus str. Sao Paulo]EMS36558.1 translation initiation factor IF-1 [Candidatus Liberibacter americanus PW_SP]
MPKEQVFKFIGIVSALLPDARFRVRLIEVADDDEGRYDAKDLLPFIDSVVIAYAAGRVRKNRIHILSGDKVKVEMNGYDMKRARLTYRFRQVSNSDV